MQVVGGKASRKPSQMCPDVLLDCLLEVRLYEVHGPSPDSLTTSLLVLSLSLSLSHSLFFPSFFAVSPPSNFPDTYCFHVFCRKRMTLVRQYNIWDDVLLTFTHSEENTRINNPLAYHFLSEIELHCWANPVPSLIYVSHSVCAGRFISTHGPTTGLHYGNSL